MIDRDEGGPAFPSPGVVLRGSTNRDEQQGAYEGMSLRDYFAAHAPPVQAWFKPVLPEMPGSRWSNRLGTEFYFDERTASAKCGFNGYLDANAEAIKAWYVEAEKQKQIQWPYAWADMQIKERSK